MFEEFIASFNNDIILKENWGKDNIERVSKSFGSCTQKDKDNIVAYINATLDNGKYFNWAKNTLLKYTRLSKEKKNIEAALRCFLPELIMWGYDPEFISSTLQTHFFHGKPINNDTVKQFLDVFDLRTHNYKVYFSVSSVVQHFKSILEKRLRVNFEDDGNYHFFKSDRNKIKVYFNEIKSRCPNSAAKQAYSILDMFFSFYKYVGDKKGLSMQNKAMVIEGESKPVFVSSKRQTFTVVEDVNYAEIGAQSDVLITGLLNNAQDEYFMLSKAIELHNTAISVTDLKSGFLNLWSSLEVLSQGYASDSKLGPVLDLVLSVLKKDYISLQIEELSKALKDNLSKDDYDYVLNKITTIGCEKKKIAHLVYLREYADLRQELYGKLSAFPVLRSRICLLSSSTTTKKLNVPIAAYVKRINWHLYRMYRTRNAIVHSGEIPSNLRYLGEHLHSYLDSTANEFIVKLSGDIPFHTRENIITDLKFALSRLDSYLEKDVEIDENIINVFLQPETSYVLIPRTSSENRKYIPFGFVAPDIIASDACEIISEATLYHFGILTSNVHMAWVRTVCGRLKSDYRYSKDIVYNNFPWPTPTEAQKAKIEKTAQAILDARALYPDCSLANLYDDVTMPPELRKAHQANDRAVMDAYGFVVGTPERTSESDCVAALMRRYQELTK